MAADTVQSGRWLCALVAAGQCLTHTGGIFTSAAYTAEEYPSYFGGTIPPRGTPWGLVIRVKKVEEGIFFLETENCEWVLAISHPIWQTELSEVVCRYGRLCDYDRILGAEEAQYLYFKLDQCAAAVLELLDLGKHDSLFRFITSKEQLETRIYRDNPEYAIWYNNCQLRGYGKADAFRLFCQVLGSEWEEEDDSDLADDRIKSCIKFYQGTDDARLFKLPI